MTVIFRQQRSDARCTHSILVVLSLCQSTKPSGFH